VATQIKATQQQPNVATTATNASALLERFSDPLDCLTAHLMLECAEVLAGVKPANLISLVNRTRPCGRNLYQLWHQFSERVVSRLDNLQVMLLHNKGTALLLLCYNKASLEQHLAHSGIRALLHKAGYLSEAGIDRLLAELKRRVATKKTFPHEIGLFIGYPAKDVAAFMGLIKLPFTCQGPWKIYGNPGQSLSLADQFRHKRQCMGARLSVCTELGPCLETLNRNNRHFFCQSTDNCDHYQARGTA
jgi:hypothetical protein